LNILDKHDQQGISHVWSLFSTAPSKQRKLMLQGILAVCCFPQLSYVSATVRDLIKIDFISMLPTELSFKVLSYLDTVSLCKAAQVSRRWNDLAEDDVVWHKMCEQHIAKKCKKCGWGLPLLDQKRLLKEKRVIERRAQGIARSETTDTSREGSESPCDHSNMPSNKRPLDDISESPSKKIRTDLESNAIIQRQAWKEVYKTRFKIGTNWKYGRHRLKVLKGHRNGVMCLQFQDNILATGSYDATIKIWDLDTGKELRTLEGHTSGVRCLQFFNCQLISGAMDKTIRIWNWKTGQCVRVLSGPTGDVLSVNFNNRYLCSGGKDNMVRVWNFEEKINYILRGHSDFVNSVRLDGPSRTLFSGSDDATVRLWDLNNGHLLRTYRGHVGGIQQVVLLPPEFDVDELDLLDCDHNSDSEDEANRSCARCPFPGALPNNKIFPHDPSRPNPPNFMLTASLDSTIRLWHVPTERCLRTFFGHLEGIWALAADNLRVVSGAEDRMVKIWDPRSGKCERTFTGHAGPVTTVGLSGDLLITGSEDCEIRVMEFGPTEEE
jgi:F-box and WD-40 domain protein MET30